jgi:hypothetical protein
MINFGFAATVASGFTAAILRRIVAIRSSLIFMSYATLG